MYSITMKHDLVFQLVFTWLGLQLNRLTSIRFNIIESLQL